MTKLQEHRKLMEVFYNCIDKLDAIGIEYGRITEISINRRAKTRCGQCRKEYDRFSGKYFTINISAFMFSEKIPAEGLESIVMHEILHTCDDCFNHGTEWKILANKVNRAYGLNVSRTYDVKACGITNEDMNITVKHRFVCQKCGVVVDRQRDSKFTRNYRNYRCGCCKGKFEKII